MNDAYNLQTLGAALDGTPFAGKLHHFAEIDSTNTHAMHAGAEEAPHGSVYFADAQTAGRGRAAHSWSSPPGSGLYLSVLLRPALHAPLFPGDALWLSLAAGVAAQTAVAETAGFRPDLRWPNDLLVGPRKLGGILTEMQAEATRVRFVVIGIGVNVHTQAFPPELAEVATSLAREAPGAQLSRQGLLIALLRALAQETPPLMSSQPQAAQRSLVQKLEAGSSWVRGKRVTVGEEQPFTGITEGLDARGFLKVRADTGELRTVLSGGVREGEN